MVCLSLSNGIPLPYRFIRLRPWLIALHLSVENNLAIKCAKMFCLRSRYSSKQPAMFIREVWAILFGYTILNIYGYTRVSYPDKYRCNLCSGCIPGWREFADESVHSHFKRSDTVCHLNYINTLCLRIKTCQAVFTISIGLHIVFFYFHLFSFIFF